MSRADELRDAGVRLGDDRYAGARAVMPSTLMTRSDAPTPQLAPIASGSRIERLREIHQRRRRDAHHRASGRVEARGERVRHPHARGGDRGRADFLERRHRLDPCDVGAAFCKPGICSSKTSIATASVSSPSGSNSSPVGPTDPATTTGRPGAVRDGAASCAAIRLISRDAILHPCSIRRRALPPKVLVRMMSEPASTKPWCSFAPGRGVRGSTVREPRRRSSPSRTGWCRSRHRPAGSWPESSKGA